MILVVLLVFFGMIALFGGLFHLSHGVVQAFKKKDWQPSVIFGILNLMMSGVFIFVAWLGS
jgi:hypothetical protein